MSTSASNTLTGKMVGHFFVAVVSLPKYVPIIRIDVLRSTIIVTDEVPVGSIISINGFDLDGGKYSVRG